MAGAVGRMMVNRSGIERPGMHAGGPWAACTLKSSEKQPQGNNRKR